MFNRVLATVRAFLRDTVTTDHVLYHDVASLEGLPELVKRPKRPQNPDQARAVREALGGDVGIIASVLTLNLHANTSSTRSPRPPITGRLHVIFEADQCQHNASEMT